MTMREGRCVVHGTYFTDAAVGCPTCFTHAYAESAGVAHGPDCDVWQVFPGGARPCSCPASAYRPPKAPEAARPPTPSNPSGAGLDGPADARLAAIRARAEAALRGPGHDLASDMVCEAHPTQAWPHVEEAADCPGPGMPHPTITALRDLVNEIPGLLDRLADAEAQRAAQGADASATDTPRDVMPRVGGKPFRCECGCNVFREVKEPPVVLQHPEEMRGPAPLTYQCNSCGLRWGAL
jgi:hypothetical protein